MSVHWEQISVHRIATTPLDPILAAAELAIDSMQTVAAVMVR